MTASRLDSRTWLVWGVAVMIPLLITRHPVLVLELLAVIATVRLVWADRMQTGWGWIVRVAGLFVLIGIVFNALTVRTGNQELFQLPDDLPLIGGPITLNAMVYGLVSGVAMLSLVLAGTSVAPGLSWTELLRVMPARFANIAVAGSISWSFLPGASRAFADIRESQAARGHRVRGARDIPQLVVPLLEGGLERALTMSEALEARGFGASPDNAPTRSAHPIWTVLALASVTSAAFAFALGNGTTATVSIVIAAIVAMIALRTGGSSDRISRYREPQLSGPDGVVMAASALSLAAFAVLAVRLPDALLFNPYPNLTWPNVSALTLLVFVPLAAPAVYVALPENAP